MKDSLIKSRNLIIKFFYKNLLKKIFFLMDPEDAHDRCTAMGVTLGKLGIFRGLTKLAFDYSNNVLEQDVLGIHFKNPIGLAAGFDKNAQLTDILPYVGFGFEEVGSITGEPCPGNPKPRLWRLKKSNALVVYYGLKNDGCEVLSKKLAHQKFKYPVGISIAKTNNQETCTLETGVEDYIKAFKHFLHIGDYVTINISCPNTFGGEPFTDPHKLEKLLTETDKLNYKKPIFLKLAADLTEHQVNSIIEVCDKHKIDGFICSNLTKKRENLKIVEPESEVPKVGGISGKAVEDLSNDLIRYVYKKTNGKYIIMGCGGVFNAKDAYKKIKQGAPLIQMITGMIFEGPQVISEINLGLAELLKKDGYTNISQAIGVDNK